MVVFWTVEGLVGGVDERMHFCTHSEGVEVGDAEDLELGHDGFGVGAGGDSADEADDALLCFDQWLEVGFPGIAGPPD